jgi:hypothetical protein
MAKHNIQIDDSILYKQIIDYCKINNLKIGAFVTDMLKKQFAIEQYGDIPFGNFNDSEPINEIKPVLTEDYKTPESIETKAVYIPCELKTKEKTLTNVNANMSTYTEKEAPKEYYSILTKEDINKAVEIIEENTKKPKKRRL